MAAGSPNIACRSSRSSAVARRSRRRDVRISVMDVLSLSLTSAAEYHQERRGRLSSSAQSWLGGGQRNLGQLHVVLRLETRDLLLQLLLAIMLGLQLRRQIVESRLGCRRLLQSL